MSDPIDDENLDRNLLAQQREQTSSRERRRRRPKENPTPFEIFRKLAVRKGHNKKFS